MLVSWRFLFILRFVSSNPCSLVLICGCIFSPQELPRQQPCGHGKAERRRRVERAMGAGETDDVLEDACSIEIAWLQADQNVRAVLHMVGGPISYARRSIRVVPRPGCSKQVRIGGWASRSLVLCREVASRTTCGSVGG